MKYVALIFVMLFSLLSYAGNEVGNGGGVIVDRKTGKPIVFFDAWETTERYGYIVIRTVDKSNDVEEALTFLNRIKKFDLELHKELSDWAQTFYNEIQFTDNDLPLIFDTGTGIKIPENLKIAQLIIQRRLGPSDVQYLINEKLWKGLSADQRGIAILHEIVYRKAIQVNPNLFNSVNVRLFVGMIISDRISHVGKNSFENIATTLGIKPRTY